jgi:type I restriction enzyme, S subunit
MNKQWPLVTLGEILTERQEVPSPDALAKGEIRILAKIGFDDGKIQLRTGTETRTGMILIRPGDLVVSGINAAKGAIAIYENGHSDPIAATIHYGAYIPDNERVDVRYLWWLLRSGTFRDLLFEFVPGGIKTELKAKRLSPIPIPLPPLSEQRRIVARIDELAGKIEEACTLRQKAVEEAEALTASLLVALLPQKIATKRLGDLIAPDSKISYGVLVPGPDMEDGVPFVRVQDLNLRNPTEIPNKHISPEVEAQYSRTRLRGGEILIGVVGSIGKVGIAPPSWAGANIARAVCRIAPSEAIDRDYLALVLSAQPSQDYFRETTRTLAQPTLNVAQLSETPIPVPPLPEQRRIVSELEGLQAEVDALKRLQAETAAKLDAMLPSILDRAFRGELRC